MTNGMLPGWAVNATDSQFLSYSDLGFIDAGFNLSSAAATLAAAFGTGVERATISGTLTMGSQAVNVYALQSSAAANLTSTAGTVTLSGGALLVAGGAMTISGEPGTNGIVFGSTGTPLEADIFLNGQNLTIGTLGATPFPAGTDAGITANGTLVKGGSGTLIINSVQTVANIGTVYLNAGGLTINNPTVITGGNMTVNMNGANSSLNLNSNGSSAVVNANNQFNTFALNVVLGQNMPIENLVVNNNGTGSGFTIGINNLTFNPEAAGPQGQLASQPQVLQVTAANTVNLQVNGTTALGSQGTVAIWTNSTTANQGNVTLAGSVTGAATLQKLGGITLFLGAQSNVITPTTIGGTTAGSTITVSSTAGMFVGEGFIGTNSSTTNGVNTIASILSATQFTVTNALSTTTAASWDFGVPVTSNAFNGGVQLIGGTLQVSGNALTAQGTALATSGTGTALIADSLGSNAVNILGSGTQLNLRADGGSSTTTNFEIALFNNTVNVNANSTINVAQFSGSGGTNKEIALSALNIGSQTLTVSSANTYSLALNSTTLTGLPTFNTSNQLVFNGNVSDGGAGLFITKNGASDIFFNTTNTGFSGGVIVNQGGIRFGTPAITAPSLVTLRRLREQARLR